jgi:hypothetical protein
MQKDKKCQDANGYTTPDGRHSANTNIYSLSLAFAIHKAIDYSRL